MIKSLPSVWNTQVLSLGWEDTLQKEIFFPGIALQYSCLENPVDDRAWQATVHWVAKSQTQQSDFTLEITAVKADKGERVLKLLRASTVLFVLYFSQLFKIDVISEFTEEEAGAQKIKLYPQGPTDSK